MRCINFRKEGQDFVNLVDTLAYVIAGEADLDFQLFSRVFQTQKVNSKTQRIHLF